MKRFIVLAIALCALVSCGLKEEFQPVGTGTYVRSGAYTYYNDADFLRKDGSSRIITIADLAKTYTPGKPYIFLKDKDKGIIGDEVLKGRVSTTDQPGNFYKSFFIQDETGGIEIKVGKNGLYNDYLEGQTVYVVLKDLTVGMYGYKTGNYGGMGMLQVGFADPSGEYETSYMEIAYIIETHVLRGNPMDRVKVTPRVVLESQLPDAKSATQKNNDNVGRLVTLKGLKYAGETFVLLYLDSNKDKKSGTNRVFLSDSNGNGKWDDLSHGINTWAMSKNLMKQHLLNGDWDDAEVASGSVYLLDEAGNHVTLGDLKGDGTYPGVEKAAYSVSQYFTMGGTEIQIRTSGFCKFSDKEIPAEVLSGRKSLDVTGILSLYQGSIQFTVNSLSDFVVDGKPLE